MHSTLQLRSPLTSTLCPLSYTRALCAAMAARLGEISTAYTTCRTHHAPSLHVSTLRLHSLRSNAMRSGHARSGPNWTCFGAHPENPGHAPCALTSQRHGRTNWTMELGLQATSPCSAHREVVGQLDGVAAAARHRI